MPFSDIARQCYAKSSSQLVDFQILHGNVIQFDHVPSEPTNWSTLLW